MERELNFKQVHFYLLTCMIFLSLTSSESVAQKTDSSKLRGFKITLEITQNGVKLQCEKGCAWKKLSFRTTIDATHTIDEFGMTELDENLSNQTTDLANFLFTLTNTEYGITLNGVEGTAWIDLSFSSSYNRKWAINQFGMTNLN